MGIFLSRCRRPSRWSCVVPLVARVQLAGHQSGVPTSKRIGRCPDVIEAHEKYERGPLPVADVWSRISRPPPPPPPSPPPPQPPPLSQKAPSGEQRLTAKPERRKLPTQHQHPFNARLCLSPVEGDEGKARPTATLTSNLLVSRSRSRLTAPDPRVARAIDKPQNNSCFGYDIRDVDSFLAEASLDRPANIPMVLCRAAPLLRWPEAAVVSAKVSSPPPQLMLPLGMVVNGVFRQNSWLYAQTPHGHEGFIRYAASLPLGILPSPQSSTNSNASPPCWESASDVFPRPRGFSAAGRVPLATRSERGYSENKRHRKVARSGVTGAGEAEKGLDKLYLRALQQRCGPSVQMKHVQHDFGFV